MRLPAVALVLLVLAPSAGRADDADRKSKDVEDAVGRALVHLSKTQQGEGSWSANRVTPRHPGVTALCVMAFLSAGHVPGEERYGDAVEKGLRSVLRWQQASGLITTEGHLEMYNHGICTLMLAEAVAVTDGPLHDELRGRLDRAVAVILKAQRKDGTYKGGWRYTVSGYDADMSVTGWQLLALRAAAGVGCEVPREVTDRAAEFATRCREPITGGFRYIAGSGAPTPSCTAAGILALLARGKDADRSEDVLKAADFLLKGPPRWGSTQFASALYFGSQATCRVGGRHANAYREHVHKVLLANQSDDGGWDGGDTTGQIYGRNYATAMAVLALTADR
jgi:hypothetical protein